MSEPGDRAVPCTGNCKLLWVSQETELYPVLGTVSCYEWARRQSCTLYWELWVAMSEPGDRAVHCTGNCKLLWVSQETELYTVLGTVSCYEWARRQSCTLYWELWVAMSEPGDRAVPCTGNCKLLWVSQETELYTVLGTVSCYEWARRQSCTLYWEL